MISWIWMLLLGGPANLIPLPAADHPDAQPGWQVFRVEQDRFERDVQFWSPPGAQSPPVILLLHPATTPAEEFVYKSGFAQLAAQEGFAIAMPAAVPTKGWTTFPEIFPEGEIPTNDVEFLDLVIDFLVANDLVDPSRIHLVGHRSGGMMAFRYGGERSARLASMAVVTGTGGATLMTPDGLRSLVPAPDPFLPLLFVHGLEDESIPFAGGLGTNARRWLLPVADTVQRWIGGWDGVTTESWPDAEVRLHPWGLQFYTLPGKSEIWPDRLPTVGTGEIRPTAEVIWAFLRQYQRAMS